MLQYLEQLYQIDPPPPTFSADASDVAVPVPEPPIKEEPPNLTEVREAISKLKAADICDILAFPLTC